MQSQILQAQHQNGCARALLQIASTISLYLKRNGSYRIFKYEHQQHTLIQLDVVHVFTCYKQPQL